MTLASIFRDSSGYLDRYFAQINDLETVLEADVHLVLAEGDSTDDTYELLTKYLAERDADDTLLKVDHGGPKFGSVDHPQRWAQVALVCNAVMDALPDDGPKVYVESDLMWNPHTMVQLLADLAEVEAVAPMSMRGRFFYDLWGHRGLDGERFTMHEPFHADLEHSDAPLVEIGSAGSCVAMRPEVARVARFGENDCIVGLGREIRYAAHAHLYLDRRVAVHHPEDN